LGISTSRIPYHDFNKEQMAPVLVRKIQEGEDIALITDAGTPGIADPAFFLVRMALGAGIRVTPVPGPCAAVAALVASGLPPDRFVFENFAPKKKNKRIAWLQSLQNEKRTVIVYESPKRIVDFLEDLREVFGNIPVVVARELTKMFEEILRMPAEQMIRHFQANQPKGEFVVLFNLRYPGPPKAEG
jgi:16S rRNA (cytidine1402-2'-O)-methyltransferase